VKNADAAMKRVGSSGISATNLKQKRMRSLQLTIDENAEKSVGVFSFAKVVGDLLRSPPLCVANSSQIFIYLYIFKHLRRLTLA
jgi:hypothetical protein